MFKYTEYLKGYIPFLFFVFLLYLNSRSILIDGVTGWRLTAAYISSLLSIGMLTAGVIAYLMNKYRNNTIDEKNN